MRAALIGFRRQVYRATVEFHKSLGGFEKCREPRSRLNRNECCGERLDSWANRGVADTRRLRRKAMTKTLQQNLTRQLCDSVDRLQKQVEKVEFWAAAVTGLTAPVPDYQPEDTAFSRFVKPGPAKKRRPRSGRNAKAGAKPASA